MTTIDIKNDVTKIVQTKLLKALDSVEDNLAAQIMQELPEYNMDWCGDDASSRISARSRDIIEDAVNQITKAEVDVLFENLK